MKTDKKILLDWAATYGEDKYDVRASMYGEDLMIEFAKYYHTEQLNLFGVSRSLKEKYKKGFIEWYEDNKIENQYENFFLQDDSMLDFEELIDLYKKENEVKP